MNGVSFYNGLSYPEQLETKEWKSRRNAIILRDENRCRLCGKGQSVNLFFSNSNLWLYLGIDYSKKEICCQKENMRIKSIKLKDYINSCRPNQIQAGKLPGSNFVSIVTDKRMLLYTVCTNVDIVNCQSWFDSALVAEIISGEGESVPIVYQTEADLKDMSFPRIYIQEAPIVLQVHHKRYYTGMLAWEYDDSDLVTLCQECHSKIHKLFPVQVFINNNGILKVMNYTPCERCNGTGYFPEYEEFIKEDSSQGIDVTDLI